jgi:hypothetical protein
MTNPHQFFMSTAGEYGPLASPRACREKGRLRDDFRDDHMLIEIDPPLDGQRFGLGAREIKQLIISAHSLGQTLYPIVAWPCYVYVVRILDEAVLETRAIRPEQVELIAWGVLFRTLEEASKYAKRFQ